MCTSPLARRDGAHVLRDVGIPTRPNPCFDFDDDIALDGVTGVVHCFPGDASRIYQLNKDLNSFAQFLHRWRRNA